MAESGVTNWALMEHAFYLCVCLIWVGDKERKRQCVNYHCTNDGMNLYVVPVSVLPVEG